MAATTISLSALTDDTGSAAAPNGDGTILNNAWFQSTLCAAINACWSSQFEIGGRFTADGFGTHTFSAGGTGGQVIAIRNTTAGTGNYAAVFVGNNSSSSLGYLRAQSSTYTTSGPTIASGVQLVSEGAGGLTLVASDAAGTIGFYTGGTTLRGTIDPDGQFTWSVMGDHSFVGSYNGEGYVRARNTSAGGSAITTMQIANNTSQYLKFSIFGTGYSGATAPFKVDYATISTDQTLGLAFYAEGYRFYLGSAGHAYFENGMRVYVGTATHVGRTVTNVTNGINLYDGTAPSGTMANGVTLYSAAGELRVMDAGGTSSLLSPHDDDGKWVFDSDCPITGKRLHVRMEDLVKFIDQQFGTDFVSESDLEAS